MKIEVEIDHPPRQHEVYVFLDGKMVLQVAPVTVSRAMIDAPFCIGSQITQEMRKPCEHRSTVLKTSPKEGYWRESHVCEACGEEVHTTSVYLE